MGKHHDQEPTLTMEEERRELARQCWVTPLVVLAIAAVWLLADYVLDHPGPQWFVKGAAVVCGLWWGAFLARAALRERRIDVELRPDENPST